MKRDQLVIFVVKFMGIKNIQRNTLSKHVTWWQEEGMRNKLPRKGKNKLS